MKTLFAILLCSAALAPAALAAETGAALPSGKPAGVKQAQMENAATPWLWIGLGAAAIAIIAVSSGGDSKSTPSTNSTSP